MHIHKPTIITIPTSTTKQAELQTCVWVELEFFAYRKMGWKQWQMQCEQQQTKQWINTPKNRKVS